MSLGPGLLLALVGSCAGRPGFTAADRAAVAGVLESQRQAWNRGDLDGYMAGYRATPDLVFTSGGKIRRGWQETRAAYQKRYGGNRQGMGQLHFEVLDIQPVGADGAVMLGRWRLTDTAEAGGGVFTAVFARTGTGTGTGTGRWEIIHDHTSSEKQ